MSTRTLDLAATADRVLGRLLVREYVEATRHESVAAGEPLSDASIAAMFPELVDFAAVYATPRAGYLVAEDHRAAIAGAGVVPVDTFTCEMKRLWVRPDRRRCGVARDLSLAVITHATELGFVRMTLDVVPWRAAAIALYRGLGFTDREATPEQPHRTYPVSMIYLALGL